MKKSLVTILLLALALPIAASETRVMTMGDNNTILLDEHNIVIFPSRLFDYPNLAIGEFASEDFTQFGVHLKFNENKPWVLGAYLHNGTPEVHSYSPIDLPTRLGQDTPLSNKRLDLYYARMLGDGKFGAHFGMRHSSSEANTATVKDEKSFNIYRFDFGFTPDGDKFDLSAGLEFMGWTDKGTYQPDAQPAQQVTLSEPDGNLGFHMMARMFHQLNSTSTIIPHAAIRYGKYNSKHYDAETQELNETVETNFTAIELGAGLQYTPAKNVLTVIDVGFSLDNMTEKTLDVPDDELNEVKTDITTLPYFKIGFDADVFKWMDVRFGATSFWRTEKVEQDLVTALNETTYKYPDNETYLGFGFHWNRLHVDVHANPSMFLDGFNFLSGESNSMNFRISGVYEMM